MTVAILLKCYLKYTECTLSELLHHRDSAGLNHGVIAMFVSTREASTLFIPRGSDVLNRNCRIILRCRLVYVWAMMTAMMMMMIINM